MSGRANERTTCLYTGQLKDENLAPVSLVDIVSLELTLYDAITGTIINGRDGQNVLNNNGVTVNSTGFISWLQTKDDNIIIDDTLDTELHIAKFKCVYSVNRELEHEFIYRVVNLGKVN